MTTTAARKSKRLSWWIKERYNPQLGTYYVGSGQMTEKAAADIEKHCLYGEDMMHEYRTEADYLAKLAELKKSGLRVQ